MIHADGCQDRSIRLCRAAVAALLILPAWQLAPGAPALAAEAVTYLFPAPPSLPPDLQQQASGSRFFAQYCRGGTRWTCRPDDLPGTDLTFAFEQG